MARPTLLPVPEFHFPIVVLWKEVQRTAPNLAGVSGAAGPGVGPHAPRFLSVASTERTVWVGHGRRGTHHNAPLRLRHVSMLAGRLGGQGRGPDRGRAGCEFRKAPVPGRARSPTRCCVWSRRAGGVTGCW